MDRIEEFFIVLALMEETRIGLGSRRRVVQRRLNISESVA